jgi:Flp pilus assembly secretin CpaC
LAIWGNLVKIAANSLQRLLILSNIRLLRVGSDMRRRALSVVCCGLLGLITAVLAADPAAQARQRADVAVEKATVAAPLTTVDPVMELSVAPGRSRLLRAKSGIRRTAIDNPAVSEVVQVSSRDLLIVGKRVGTTGLTVWTGETSPPVTILVRVAANKARTKGSG